VKAIETRRRVLSALGLGVVAAALASPAAVAQMRLRADEIVIIKHLRVLELLQHGHIIRRYPIALGPHPFGPKERAGDGRTPEGFYIIDYRTRDTPYHLALHLSYPNEIDRVLAREDHVNPGGDIFIHGMPARFGETDPVKFFRDWTEGCVSVGNLAIEQIWDAVPDGTEVVIKP
jgi:murein L,D-transpeptidase YafK